MALPEWVLTFPRVCSHVPDPVTVNACATWQGMGTHGTYWQGCVLHTPHVCCCWSIAAGSSAVVAACVTYERTAAFIISQALRVGLERMPVHPSSGWVVTVPHCMPELPACHRTTFRAVVRSLSGASVAPVGCGLLLPWQQCVAFLCYSLWAGLQPLGVTRTQPTFKLCASQESGARGVVVSVMYVFACHCMQPVSSGGVLWWCQHHGKP